MPSHAPSPEAHTDQVPTMWEFCWVFTVEPRLAWDSQQSYITQCFEPQLQCRRFKSAPVACPSMDDTTSGKPRILG